MIKYKTKKHYADIEVVEVTRETECFVWTRGRLGDSRQAKISEWARFHDSWQEAKDYLVAREQMKVDGLRAQLERAKGALGNAKGLREPS